MASTASNPPQLRVRKLTLYSHGMASLELSTCVQGDAILHLSFPEPHMNDVLKSLTVVDTEGGQIASISYEAPSQTAHTNLDTLRVDRNNPITSLLENAQGASVDLRRDDDFTFSGTVLGLQHLPAAHPNQSAAKTLNLVILETGHKVSMHDVTKLAFIGFRDELLQKQLDRRMRASLASLHAKNNKHVTITAKGEGERTILVNYSVESPVPKLTYRFLLQSGPENQNANQTISVQGWAIVDNPSDEDLEDIDVTIVSGLPISFRHDLYGARFVERPEEEVPTASGPGYDKPSHATFGKRAVRQRADEMASDLILRRSMPGPQLRSAPAMNLDAELEGYDEDNTVPEAVHGLGSQEAQRATALSAADTSEVGNLFEYSIPTKVTIKAQESALVPLIVQECEGGRVGIYSHKVRPANTLSAIRINNTTDATFEGGPVSVYERSRLIGEGMMAACRPGGEQFLPYSVDLDCLAEMTSQMRREEVVCTIAVGAFLKTTFHLESVKQYVFHSHKPDDVDLYVLHEVSERFTLEAASLKVTLGDGEAQARLGASMGSEVSIKPIEIREGVARFRFNLPSGQSATIRVRERKQHLTSYEIRKSCTERAILDLRRNNVINEKTAEKMREIMELEAQILVMRTEIRTCRSEVEALEGSQARFRENLKSLGGLKESNRYKDNPLIEKYINSLHDSETKIEETLLHQQNAENRARTLEKNVTEKVLMLSTGEHLQNPE